MGWFDEQISRRRQKDQESMEDALFHIASAVVGAQQAGYMNDKRIPAKTAVDDILKYYHRKPAAVPENITELDDYLEYCMRPLGIMWRRVTLEEGWYKNAMGPMLGFNGEGGAACALIPGKLSGYRYRDPETGAMVRVDKKTASRLDDDALCFYCPLPLRKIGVRDLILYLTDCLDMGDFMLFFLLSLGVTLLGMVMTSITRSLTGFVLESGDLSLLAGTAAFMIAVILSSQLISASGQLMMSRIGTKASVAMEAAVMMRIMDLPPGFFRKHSSGELSGRFQALAQICSVLLNNVFSVGISALLSLLYITQIFHYARPLAFTAFLIIFAGLILSVLAGLAQMQVSRYVLEKGTEENGISFALISGVQKIRLTGAEKRAFAKWGHAYAETSELRYNPPMIIRANTALSAALSLAGTVLLFWIAVNHRITPSEYIAFNTAFGAVTASFGALAGVALSFAEIKPMLETAEPILSAVPEGSEKRTLVTELSGDIEVSNLYFRYQPNMPWVVNGLNLKIRPGEYIAIVGTTGCGKSTLIRLLLGFETPEVGAVYYDGRDLSGLDLHSLRRQIGTVMQNGSLFQGDIFSNIAVSAPQMTLKDAWEAAELAGIADDIRRMPMGMQTQLSEGQGGISGGQKQRLMIARALAPKPRILIFDEATSALDNRVQKQISEALDGLNCTRIVIAHRLSTIRNCSRILVLDQGKIIEDGSYEELVEKNGLFAELIARQRLDS